MSKSICPKPKCSGPICRLSCPLPNLLMTHLPKPKWTRPNNQAASPIEGPSLLTNPLAHHAQAAWHSLASSPSQSALPAPHNPSPLHTRALYRTHHYSPCPFTRPASHRRTNPSAPCPILLVSLTKSASVLTTPSTKSQKLTRTEGDFGQRKGKDKKKRNHEQERDFLPPLSKGRPDDLMPNRSSLAYGFPLKPPIHDLL